MTDRILESEKTEGQKMAELFYAAMRINARLKAWTWSLIVLVVTLGTMAGSLWYDVLNGRVADALRACSVRHSSGGVVYSNTEHALKYVDSDGVEHDVSGAAYSINSSINVANNATVAAASRPTCDASSRGAMFRANDGSDYYCERGLSDDSWTWMLVQSPGDALERYQDHGQPIADKLAEGVYRFHRPVKLEGVTCSYHYNEKGDRILCVPRATVPLSPAFRPAK